MLSDERRESIMEKVAGFAAWANKVDSIIPGARGGSGTPRGHSYLMQRLGAGSFGAKPGSVKAHVRAGSGKPDEGGLRWARALKKGAKDSLPAAAKGKQKTRTLASRLDEIRRKNKGSGKSWWQKKSY